MSDIEFSCPHCNHSLVVDAEGAGTTVDCPQCAKPIQIPSPRRRKRAAASERTAECPYCKEEIKETAIKCKHCGSDLSGDDESSADEEDETPDEGEDIKRRGLSGFTWFLLQIVLCLSLLYAGGWEPIWEEDIFSHKDFLVEDHGLAVRVNDKYYGLRFHARFFDSPVVSWGLLMATLGITPVFLIPFGGKSGSSNALD